MVSNNLSIFHLCILSKFKNFFIFHLFVPSKLSRARRWTSIYASEGKALKRCSQIEFCVTLYIIFEKVAQVRAQHTMSTSTIFINPPTHQQNRRQPSTVSEISKPTHPLVAVDVLYGQSLTLIHIPNCVLFPSQITQVTQKMDRYFVKIRSICCSSPWNI